MTHSEFLSKMVDLEFAINALTKALNEEMDNTSFKKEDGKVDIDRYMKARTIVNLANSLTTTKLSIDYFHKEVYKEEE